MKKILPMLLLTVMLRVWWDGGRTVTGAMQYEGGSGIVVVGGVDHPTAFLVVKTDSGEIIGIHAKAVTKMKWVEVKAEK